MPLLDSSRTVWYLQDYYSIITLDLRLNSIEGDLPCELCDNFNKDNERYIFVDCADEFDPVVNCRCCYQDWGQPCSALSVANHEAECPTPSKAPSGYPTNKPAYEEHSFRLNLGVEE